MKHGRPSASALLVALSVLREGRDHQLPETSRELARQALRAAGGYWRALAWLAQRHWGLALLAAMQALLLPGLAAHHCRRKRWIAERLQSRERATRLTVVGVGYDGLGLALCQADTGLRLIELDHPDSLQLRQQLPVWRARAADRCLTRPLVLPAQTAELLLMCGHEHSVLVIEGVLMYLPLRSVLRLLRGLAALPQPPRLLFSALTPTVAAGSGFARDSSTTRHWLRRQREPFLWRCATERLEGVLAGYGYRIDARWDGAGFGEYVIDASPGPECQRSRKHPPVGKTCSQRS